MAEPYLLMPNKWVKGTLDPDSNRNIISKVETGSTPKTSVDEYWDGDVPWLTPKEITKKDGLFVTYTERNISEHGLSNTSAKLLPPGTVMLSKRAPVGAVAVNTRPMCTNQGFLNFTCGDLLRPVYFAYWLKVNKPYLDAIANGSTYPELYKSDLFEFEICVPPLEQQDEIISVISALQFARHSGIALEQSVTKIGMLEEIHKKNNALGNILDDMLYLIFSGEISVEELKNNFVRDV